MEGVENTMQLFSFIQLDAFEFTGEGNVATPFRYQKSTAFSTPSTLIFFGGYYEI